MSYTLKIFKHDKLLSEYRKGQTLIDPVELQKLFDQYQPGKSRPNAINSSELLTAENIFLTEIFTGLERLRSKLARIPTRIAYPATFLREEYAKRDTLGYYCFGSDYYDYPYVGLVLEQIVRHVLASNYGVGVLDARKYLIATVLLHEAAHALLGKETVDNLPSAYNLLEESFANLISLVAVETINNAYFADFYCFIDQFVSSQPPEYSFGKMLFRSLLRLNAYSPKLAWEIINVYAEMGCRRAIFIDEFIQPKLPGTDISSVLTNPNHPSRDALADAIIDALKMIAVNVIAGINALRANGPVKAADEHQIRRSVISGMV